MSTTEEMLNETFRKVGNDFGIGTKAEYAAFRDFKVRWQRTYQWAEYQVSDCLMDAPEEVIGRGRRISSEPDEHKNLEEALNRLREKGFIGDAEKLRFSGRTDQRRTEEHGPRCS